MALHIRLPALSCIALLLLTGCSSETLFRSDFSPSTIGDPPAQTQPVGTLKVWGPGVTVVAAPPDASPSGKWVEITRTTSPTATPGIQGQFTRQAGDGIYTFSAVLYLPTGSNGPSTIQFERSGATDFKSFLHLDFMADNTVRIDDGYNGPNFGNFPRNKPFGVQVTLNINASPSAHIVLYGDGASGTADCTVLPPFRGDAHLFGAVRAWIGFPNEGTFDITNIVVTKRNN
ncbi:hypothetical protein FHS83_003427 [Rhizomicrobium palustre]|uniref:Uncharacterized protein n=1 Tax=Rhizomicrobium palustre TaxID=189966 RepID=A0A846N3M0_9PROT|nr:hypothetical protein [Rhizomicrobium palustre]NIK90109.1 hypothetical protein [Rhizomicrobium palustre]